MITEATISNVRYFPELLPDSAVPTIAAGSEAPTILDLRRVSPLLVRLSEVAVDRDNEVETRFRVDTATLNALAGSMLDGLKNSFSLLAKEKIYYNLYNKGAGAKTNYKTFFSLWVIKPTIAHKLRYGIRLTSEEAKLATDLGIVDTVQKGLLPLPLSVQIDREYQAIQEETHGFQVTVPTAGVTVATLAPANGQFLVLTKLSASPGSAAADNIRVAIDRDYQSDYVEFPSWALGTTDAAALGKEIGCFIPALSELRIKLKATVSGDINIRYTVWKCALTNLFKIKWGLVSRDELPDKQKEAYDKVVAGVL